MHERQHMSFEDKAYELFEKTYPNTCRMPSGDKWPIEKSKTLQLIHEAFDLAKQEQEGAAEISRDCPLCPKGKLAYEKTVEYGVNCIIERCGSCDEYITRGDVWGRVESKIFLDRIKSGETEIEELKNEIAHLCKEVHRLENLAAY